MMAYNSESPRAGYSAWPRWVSFILGIWLIISAFAWPHTSGEQTNAWILGILIAVASIWAMYSPGARYLNTIFSIWLFFATLVIMHSHAGTLWNNLILAIIVFVMSLIPSSATTMRPGGRRVMHAS